MTVAVAIVLAATIVPPLLAQFLDQHLGMTVKLHDMAEERIRVALKRNEVDIAIGTLMDDDPEVMTNPRRHRPPDGHVPGGSSLRAAPAGPVGGTGRRTVDRPGARKPPA